MANRAIMGINWGDKGKGRMVDPLTENYDVIVRYQGGGKPKNHRQSIPASSLTQRYRCA